LQRFESPQDSFTVTEQHVAAHAVEHRLLVHGVLGERLVQRHEASFEVIVVLVLDDDRQIP
jgi:hypothetical protein